MKYAKEAKIYEVFNYNFKVVGTLVATEVEEAMQLAKKAFPYAHGPLSVAPTGDHE